MLPDRSMTSTPASDNDPRICAISAGWLIVAGPITSRAGSASVRSAAPLEGVPVFSDSGGTLGTRPLRSMPAPFAPANPPSRLPPSIDHFCPSDPSPKNLLPSHDPVSPPAIPPTVPKAATRGPARTAAAATPTASIVQLTHPGISGLMSSVVTVAPPIKTFDDPALITALQVSMSSMRAAG